MLIFLKFIKNPWVIIAIILSLGLMRVTYLKSKVTKVKLELEIVKNNFNVCQDENEINLSNIESLKQINIELANKWTQATEDNKKAIEQVNQEKAKHDEEINRIKAKIKPVQACDNMRVSPEHIRLLQQASDS